jgi:hypothetical protein
VVWCGVVVRLLVAGSSGSTTLLRLWCLTLGAESHKSPDTVRCAALQSPVQPLRCFHRTLNHM